MSPATKGRQVQLSLYVSPELAERLKKLSEKTRIPQAAYLREAVEDLLAKHEEEGKRRKR